MSVVNTEPLPDEPITDESASVTPDQTETETPVSPPSRLWTFLFSALVLVTIARFVPVHLVLKNTTPTGGDVAGHVWFPTFVRDHLPHLSGWSDDWYAGFPAGALYFPVPALFTVLLSLVLPYGIAMKITIALAAFLLPFAAWRFASRLSFHPLAGPAAAAATVLFQTERFHTIYGGNLSSVLAGEFSFAIAFALALFSGSMISSSLADPSRRVSRLLPLTMAACAMSHVLGGVFLVAICVTLLLAHPSRLVSLRRFLPPFLLSFGIATVWWLPFIAGAKNATDMAYEPTRSARLLFPPLIKQHDATTVYWYPVAVLAVLAVVYAIVRAHRGLLALTMLAGVFCGMYMFWPTTYVWDARWLPFWWFSVQMLAACGLLIVFDVLRARLSAHVAVLLLFVPSLGFAGVIPYMPGAPAAHTNPVVTSWAEWDFNGYEGKPRWEEYRSVMKTMRDLGRDQGCGRALWEYDQDQGGYGSPMAMMLLPYWTSGCIDSVEGLFMEGSETTPFHFMVQRAVSKTGSTAVRNLPYKTSRDLDWGVPAMRALGVRWYMAYNDETIADARNRTDLVEVASSEHWVVFEIASHAVVAPFSASLKVSETPYPALFADQFAADPSGSFIADIATLPAVPQSKLDALRITNVTSSERGVSFDVSSTGVPVVVRQSWYPTWKVSGATGPFRAGPNMMVVVPTSRHVSLTAPTPPHRFMAELISVVSICLYAFWALRRRGARPADENRVTPPAPVLEHTQSS